MAQGELTKRIQNVVVAMGWQYPFFLPGYAYVTVKEDPAFQMGMGITADGVLKVNPTYAETLTDIQLGGVVFHELGHLLLDHFARGNSRNPRRWNRSCDRSWNQALREMGIQLPPTALYPARGQEKLTAEELYDLESEQPDDNATHNAGQGTGTPTAGCGPEGPEGEGEGNEENEQSQQGRSRQWAEVAAQAQALAAGTEHAETMARALNIPRPRVRWEQILKSAAAQALAAHGRDDQVWTKRSRRSPANGYLPGWTATRATIAIVIDTSGSMSDEEVAAAIAETAKIGQIAGIRVFLALHDAACYWSGWLLARADDVARRVTGRGGTDFDGAYAAVGGAKGRIDVMVHLTDGEIHSWPSRPANTRRLIVAQYRDSHIRPPEGTVIVPAKV